MVIGGESWMCEIMRIFFVKQKTAYEMRISDWSSDVCSSDLQRVDHRSDRAHHHAADADDRAAGGCRRREPRARHHRGRSVDRNSVVQGKRVSVRVDRGGRRIIKQNNTQNFVSRYTPFTSTLDILTHK